MEFLNTVRCVINKGLEQVIQAVSLPARPWVPSGKCAFGIEAPIKHIYILQSPLKIPLVFSGGGKHPAPSSSSVIRWHVILSLVFFTVFLLFFSLDQDVHH